MSVSVDGRIRRARRNAEESDDPGRQAGEVELILPTNNTETSRDLICPSTPRRLIRMIEYALLKQDKFAPENEEQKNAGTYAGLSHQTRQRRTQSRFGRCFTNADVTGN